MKQKPPVNGLIRWQVHMLCVGKIARLPVRRIFYDHLLLCEGAEGDSFAD